MLQRLLFVFVVAAGSASALGLRRAESIDAGVVVVGAQDQNGFCPATGGIYLWSHPQHYAGHYGNKTATWYMSPCNKTIPSSTGHTRFFHATNLELMKSDYDTNIPFSVVATPWHRVKGTGNTTATEYRANFTVPTYKYGNNSGVWAEVTVTCDASMAQGSVVPNGVTTQVGAAGAWLVPIKMHCGSMGSSTEAPPTPSPPLTPAPTSGGDTFCVANTGGLAPSGFSWAQLEENTFLQETQLSHWFMSPCTMLAPPWHWTKVFVGLAPITQPAPGHSGWGEVRMYFDILDTPWHQVQGDTSVIRYAAKFGSSVPGNRHTSATLNVTCNSSMTVGTLAPLGTIIRSTNSFIETEWRIPVQMNCGAVTNAPPTPTPTPVPPPPNCEQFTTCETCTGSSFLTCGFCGTSGKCMNGNFNGPTGPEKTCLPESSWFWYKSQCPSN